MRQSRQFDRLAKLGLCQKYIYGKALLRYWPLNAASVIHHEDVSPAVPSPTSYRPGVQESPTENYNQE